MLDTAVIGNGVDPALPGPPRTLDLDIDPPVEVNGRTYASLHLEEPKARMIERAEAELAAGVNVHSLRKYQIALASQCSALPRPVVENMRISQVREAADFLSSFIGGGLPTGET